ncbi:hypothetical protein [Flagellimonas pacifica]|uniref:Uncharacterized protein n=1 Tax=Flagellimonas pacifica TaxID=1247520 RepID=A0A285M6W4_9FLAO|nr:hypothetical protein [Allomuricauda parva]SNY92838.1 hypothetical protein SAMN06265377_0055 [Allomuricauda parva]
MRFFKLKNLNWKYILGEILLLFVGINLAIWFNDWNASKSIQKNKEIALVKIKDELRNNLAQLEESRLKNQKIPSFFDELGSLENKEGDLVLNPDMMNIFVQRYPEFYRKMDSVKVDDKLYKYKGFTKVYLEITDLSNIAWEISKSTGIFHEFGYDCLYQLQGLYHTQDLVKGELKKATEALGNKSIDDLIRVLSFMDQLEAQLESQYKDMINNIDNCK